MNLRKSFESMTRKQVGRRLKLGEGGGLVTVPEAAVGRLAPILPFLSSVRHKHLGMSLEKSFESTTRKQTGSRLKLGAALPVPIWRDVGLVTVSEAAIGRVAAIPSLL